MGDEILRTEDTAYGLRLTAYPTLINIAYLRRVPSGCSRLCGYVLRCSRVLSPRFSYSVQGIGVLESGDVTQRLAQVVAADKAAEDFAVARAWQIGDEVDSAGPEGSYRRRQRWLCSMAACNSSLSR